MASEENVRQANWFTKSGTNEAGVQADSFIRINERGQQESCVREKS